MNKWIIRGNVRMKLLMFSKGKGDERLGLIVKDKVLDVKQAYKIITHSASPSWFNSLNELIRGGESAMILVEQLKNKIENNLDEVSQVIYDLNEIEYYPPVNPEKILCASINYKSHAEELHQELPVEPYLFVKLPNVLIGHKKSIIVPSFSRQVDYEGELAVIIGKEGKNIPRNKAYEYVFGYTIFNDVSLRDLRWGKSGKTEFNWLKAKSLDTLGPLGPWVVTKDEIKNPQKLRIRTYVNNELRQDGNTEDMIFDIATLIEYASEGITLKPGDLISTGTPPGTALRTGKFLKSGDIVKVVIENVGELENY
ncbi:FAA hydrolase family protein, partial [Sulfolobus sp. D5]